MFVGGSSVPRNFASLFLGLAVATVGIDVAVGYPRFTMGFDELYDGVSFIPAMIGLFALSELLGNARSGHEAKLGALKIDRLGDALRGAWSDIRSRFANVARSGVGGTVIGALPGAGADVAAWIAYALSRRFSRTPEKFGRGHIEGIVDGGSANNAAVAGAWTPALVFGIPGDSVTAIAIGVLLMKGLTPGPDIFTTDANLVYAIFGSFLMANILMLLTGGLAIMAATQLLRAPRPVLMPVVLMLSLIGGYAIMGSTMAIWIILALGLMGWLMVRAGIPLAPAILGIVLGRVVEDNFMVSMMKARGDLTGFFERDASAVLGVITLIVWGLLIFRAMMEMTRAGRRDNEELKRK